MFPATIECKIFSSVATVGRYCSTTSSCAHTSRRDCTREWHARANCSRKQHTNPIVAGLREEQRAVLGPAAVDENTVSSDCLILPTEHLICVECCRDYESEIAQKLEKVKAIKHLFDLLETKELERFKLDLGMNETWGNACDRYAYTVSKRFITEFRKQVSGLMKKTATAAAEAKACEFESSLVSLLAENVNEGLDGLDLSDFEKRVFGDGPEAVREVAVPNSNITCTCALGDAGLPCCCTSSQ